MSRPAPPFGPALALAAAAILAGPASGGESAASRPLFDGESFAGWFFAPHTDPRAIAAMAPAERASFLAAQADVGREHWRVDPGDGGGAELVCDGGGPYLWTASDFADFELSLEWKIAPGTDSGVYVRGCPQVQIWDATDPAMTKFQNELGSGGLWNNPEAGPNARGKDPSELADNPPGEWNAMTVRVVGESVTVTLNGVRVVHEATLENYWDRDLPLFPVGPVVLQTHGGETRWRNLTIRELPRSMPESGFLAADGEPLGEGWAAAEHEPPGETRGAGTVRVGADLHAVVGPVPLDRPAELVIGTPFGGRGPAVRFLFTGDGQVTASELSVEIGAAQKGRPDAGDPAPAGPIPGFWVDAAAAAAAFDPIEENRLYVRAAGGAVSAYLDGVPIFTALDAPGPSDGPVVVTGTAGVRFGSVRDADDRATLRDEAGFTPVPLEPGLSGWTGDVAGYEAAGGVLTCAGGGNLYLPGDHSDFALRFEFRLPPGGNNGVGLRCERGKDAAYFGMESQILDNAAAGFAGLKPYQYHGSIYGVAPALRGYLAPAGEWNREEITAVGDRVTVTLNGKTIVDADVRDLSTAGPDGGTADGRPHPGLLNPRGAVGFLGHGAPVAWRNVRMKGLSGEPGGGASR